MHTPTLQTVSARRRLALSGLLGLAAGLVAYAYWQPRYAALTGWDTAALAYVTSIFYSVMHFDHTQTKLHAVSENPGRVIGDIVLVVGSIASLIAVILLISQATNGSHAVRFVGIGLGLVSVIISWILIHTSFMLRYARVYYSNPEGGVNFNQKEPPAYSDFSYVAFTIGMAYQVSDTALQSRAMRQTALRHALLSYIFGTVIIATTINTVASLSS